MKQMNYVLTALLALAGSALLVPQARAQITVSNGDLILGIEGDSNQQGSGQDYEVDLGNIGNLSLTGVTNFGNVVSALDLATQYGTGFASSTHLSWSVIGVNYNAFGTNSDIALKSSINGVSTVLEGAVFVTGTQPVAALKDSSLSGTGVKLAGFGFGGSGTYSVASGSQTLNGAPSTANSPVAAFLSDVQSNNNSYTQLENSSQGGFFGFESAFTSKVSFGSGSTLDLYMLNSGSDADIAKGSRASLTGTSTLLGTFSWVDDGDGVADDLIFTGAQAAPEPATWAMMLGGLGLLVWTLRRKQAAALV